MGHRRATTARAYEGLLTAVKIRTRGDHCCPNSKRSSACYCLISRLTSSTLDRISLQQYVPTTNRRSPGQIDPVVVASCCCLSFIVSLNSYDCKRVKPNQREKAFSSTTVTIANKSLLLHPVHPLTLDTLYKASDIHFDPFRSQFTTRVWTQN